MRVLKTKIVKELGVYKNGQIVGYSFLPRKKFKATSESARCLKHLQGINWRSVYEKHTEIKEILKKLKAPETEFFVKGYEKYKILSENLKKRF